MKYIIFFIIAIACTSTRKEASFENTSPAGKKASPENTLPTGKKASSTNTSPAWKEVSSTNTLPGKEIIDEVKIRIYNPHDKRTLTDQGRALLARLIINSTYSTDVIRTDLSDYLPVLKESPYIKADYKGKHYIVGVWRQRGYSFVTYKSEENKELRTDKISFTAFELMKHMHLDRTHTIEVTDKMLVSFMMVISGSNTTYEVYINNERAAKGGGRGSAFSSGVPINSFLKKGRNEMHVTTGPDETGSLSITVDDYNKNYPKRIQAQFNGGEDSTDTISIHDNVEFEKQVSIF